MRTSLSKGKHQRAPCLGRRLPLRMAPSSRAHVSASPACRSEKEKRVERNEERVRHGSH